MTDAVFRYSMVEPIPGDDGERFDCPEEGFYDMTEAEMQRELLRPALTANVGVEPETTASTKVHEELQTPGAVGSRLEQSVRLHC